MATNVTLAAPEVEPPILGQIRKAQRSARDAFRFKFVLTWAVILGVVAVAIVATGNADPEFTGKWTVYILGGTGLTILISVVSITLATGLAVLGALGRLSRNGYINGVASLYVSLVRGTPLLVQIYFVFFALPAGGDRPGPDPGRHRRAGLQLRRVHDRDLPGRDPGRPARPARGGRGARHAGTPGHAPDRPAPGRADRHPGHRQRLRVDDQGQLAGQRRRASRSCCGEPIPSVAATASSSRRCSSPLSSTGR